jgi:hypothetical protein
MANFFTRFCYEPLIVSGNSASHLSSFYYGLMVAKKFMIGKGDQRNRFESLGSGSSAAL